jgi:ABC-type phosphate transport system substrate-binding protein
MKLNKKVMLQLSLDVMKIIRKKIKEELNVNQPKKNKKVIKNIGRSSNSNTGKNINNME